MFPLYSLLGVVFIMYYVLADLQLSFVFINMSNGCESKFLSLVICMLSIDQFRSKLVV